MSKQTNRVADSVFPGTGQLLDAGNQAAQDLLPKPPDLAAPGDVPTPTDNALAKDPEIAKRVTEQVPDRERELRAAAVAAGVTRSANDADLLGAGGVKRRAVSRTLLGSR